MSHNLIMFIISSNYFIYYPLFTANAPQVKGLNGDYTIHLKEKLRLTCNVTGNPSPWIVWFRNRKRLKSNKRISITNTKR